MQKKPTINAPLSDVTFKISSTLNDDTGLNFNTTNGIIDGVPTEILLPSKNYVVTITGRDGTKYEGASDSFTVNITVNKRHIETLSYNGLVTTYGEEKTVKPTLTPSARLNKPHPASYTIDPSSLPSGVTFVNSTGALSVSNLAAVSVSGTYKITATGTGNYKGSKTFDVQVTVSAKTLSAAGFSISGTKTVTALTGGSATATVAGGLTHTSDYTLSIDKGGSSVTAVTIGNDGTITIGSGITVSDAGDYTITATGQGNYTGEVTGTFALTVNPITLTSTLLGTINNPAADFTVSAGITSDHTTTLLSFTGSLTAGTDFTLAITNRPTGATEAHVSLNSTTGLLTVTTNVLPADSGSYTVTATGKNNYGSTTTASFTLSITPLAINSITYSPVTAILKTAMTQSADPTIEPAAAATGASFTISPELHTNTGLSFDTATGAISGTPTIRASGDYTVTIRGGDGTKYQGATKTSAQFSVTIDQKPIEGTLGYKNGSITTTDITTTYGTAQALNIQWDKALPEQTVTYTIAPVNPADPALPGDITFVESSGALSVSNSTAVHTGYYTITASGTGDYTGTRTVDVSITVSPKTLTAAGFTITDSKGFVTALTGGQPTVGIGGNLKPEDDYSLSISPDANGRISINNSGNITIDSGIEVSDTGDYTITATGQGNYSGTVTGTFTLTVNPKPLPNDLLGLIINNPSTDFTVSAGIANNHTTTLVFDSTLITSVTPVPPDKFKLGRDFRLAITGRPPDATSSHVSLTSTHRSIDRFDGCYS